MTSKPPIPSSITADHIRSAIADMDANGIPEAFGEPTKYYVIVGNKAYPPKAVVGVAGKFSPDVGRMLLPTDFSSGRSRGQAVGFLLERGFMVCEIIGGDAEEGVSPRVSFTNPERAAQVWHILIAAASDRRTVTYKILSGLTGQFPAGWGIVLGYLMRYCEKHGLPPLTVLVVQTDTGRPGEGLLTSQDHDANRELVYAFDWYKSVRPPTAEELSRV